MIAEKYYYLSAMILSIAFPLLLSFDKKVNFKQYFYPLFIALFSVASLFIIGDILYTYLGVWGFNDQYHFPFKLLGLPIEEILFFLFVPYACLFIFEVIKAYFKLKNSKIYPIILFTLGLMAVFVAINFYNRLYTTATFAFSAIILFYLSKTKPKYLVYLFWTYIISIIPFVLVNGFLTGMFTPEPVVWYNDYENLGTRFISIPYDDFSYSFNLIAMNIILFERLKRK